MFFVVIVIIITTIIIIIIMIIISMFLDMNNFQAKIVDPTWLIHSYPE